jgi:hypothetical protein
MVGLGSVNGTDLISVGKVEVFWPSNQSLVC